MVTATTHYLDPKLNGVIPQVLGLLNYHLQQPDPKPFSQFPFIFLEVLPIA